MNAINWKKLLLPNIPYLLFVYLFDKVGQAVRLAPGADLSGKVLSLGEGFSMAFATPLPSLAPMDLLIGIVGAVLIRLMVYFKGKNAKKYRKGIEYGSARWGNAEDIKPYTDPIFQNNVLLTQTEQLKGGYADPKNPKGRTGQRIARNSRVTGCKQKDLIGIPWLLAFSLREQGWYLRSDIIWQKQNPMPESCKDRPTRCYEHIFLLSKEKKYYYDAAAIAEPLAPTTAERYRRARSTNSKYTLEIPGQGKVQGLNRPRDGGYYDDALMPTTRNKRDVWLINTVPYKGAHFAAFPPKLAETCILAGCPKGGIVIDPFFGSGTTGFAAKSLDRHYIGIELNAEYCALARARIGGAGLSSS